MSETADKPHCEKMFLCHHYSTGFSLVELIVVIPIIVILLVILISVLNSTRQAAAKALTASDLRAIHNAVILFTQENQNQLPGPVSTAINAGFRTWAIPQLSRRLAPYLTQTVHKASGWFQVEEFEPSNYPKLAGFYDPAVRGPAYIINANTFSDPDYSLPFGYPQTANPQVPPKNLNSIPDPAKDVLLYGLDVQNLSGSPGWSQRVAREPLFKKTRPFLYWDGRVEISERLIP